MRWIVGFLVVPGFVFAAAITEWSSPEGMARLERSKQKADFFRLANHFESQRNSMACGPTTATVVLNAYRAGKDSAPEDKAAFNKKYNRYLPKGYNPVLRRYTQDGFFSSAKGKMKPADEVYGKPIKGKGDFGFQLRQFEQALTAHGLKVTGHVVDDKATVENIRKELSQNVANPADFVVVNFARKSLEQKGGGHISPLGAYDEKSDSFLVLDVNPTNSPWFWVSTANIVAAMRTMDTVENRGYVVVSEAPKLIVLD